MIEKDPRRFCIYLHRRATDNSVFYVGTGTIERSKKRGNRSEFWNSTVRKYGLVVEVVRTGLTKQCANTMEKITIAKHRSLGDRLVNLTDGGEGPLGMVHSLEVRRKMGKPVYCSNGMRFHTCLEAADWAGGKSTSLIGECCRGKKTSAYGFAWSFDAVPDHPERTGKEARAHTARVAHSKAVISDRGERFSSITEAACNLLLLGYKKGSCKSISAAIKREQRSFNRRWFYDEN